MNRPNSEPASPVPPLEALGISPSAEKLIRYFATHPGARPYARELQRTLRLGGASLQRDLDRLTNAGALEKWSEGRLVRYAPAVDSRFWRGVRLLVGDPSASVSLLRDALCDVKGLESAFVFGSTVKGSATPESDIDVFVLEANHVDHKALHRQLAEVALLLGREVNPIRFTAERLAERLGNQQLPGSRFVRDVLSGPKSLVAGSLEAIRPLALAAGIALAS